LGLRYDVSTVSREKQGRLQNFDLNTLKFTPLGQKLHDVDKNNFGPRFGFAFDVFAIGRLCFAAVMEFSTTVNLRRQLSARRRQTLSRPNRLICLLHCLFAESSPQYPVDPAAYNCAVPNAYSIESIFKRRWRSIGR